MTAPERKEWSKQRGRDERREGNKEGGKKIKDGMKKQYGRSKEGRKNKKWTMMERRRRGPKWMEEKWMTEDRFTHSIVSIRYYLRHIIAKKHHVCNANVNVASPLPWSVEFHQHGFLLCCQVVEVCVP